MKYRKVVVLEKTESIVLLGLQERLKDQQCFGLRLHRRLIANRDVDVDDNLRIDCKVPTDVFVCKLIKIKLKRDEIKKRIGVHRQADQDLLPLPPLQRQAKLWGILAFQGGCCWVCTAGDCAGWEKAECWKKEVKNVTGNNVCLELIVEHDTDSRCTFPCDQNGFRSQSVWESNGWWCRRDSFYLSLSAASSWRFSAHGPWTHSFARWEVGSSTCRNVPNVLKIVKQAKLCFCSVCLFKSYVQVTWLARDTVYLQFLQNLHKYSNVHVSFFRGLPFPWISAIFPWPTIPFFNFPFPVSRAQADPVWPYPTYPTYPREKQEHNLLTFVIYPPFFSVPYRTLRTL